MYYNKKIDDIYKELNSSKDGLDTKEVNKRLEKDGYNELIEKKSKSKFSIFLELLILLLFL